MNQEDLFSAILALRAGTIGRDAFREMKRTISARIRVSRYYHEDVLTVTIEKLALYHTDIRVEIINRVIRQRINDALFACGIVVEGNRKTLRRSRIMIQFDTDAAESASNSNWKSDFTRAEESADRFYAFHPSDDPALPSGGELFPEK